MNKFVSLLCAILASQAFADELAPTWSKGAFMLPRALADQIGAPRSTTTRIDRFSTKFDLIKTDRPVPVAIVMHGCSGITSENTAAAKLLTQMGFAVFLPTYFGRANAVPICAGSAAGVPFYVDHSIQHVEERVEEFNYALEQVKKMSFVDKNRVLAYGHSMGGVTVANLDRTDIGGVIITGWGCGRPYQRQSPTSVPQLSIKFKNDPWLEPGWECGVRAFSGRELHNTNSLVLGGQETHEVLHDVRAQEAVKSFVVNYFNLGE